MPGAHLLGHGTFEEFLRAYHAKMIAIEGDGGTLENGHFSLE